MSAQSQCGGRLSLLLLGLFLLLLLACQTPLARGQHAEDATTEPEAETEEECLTKEEKEFDSKVRVATLQFSEVEIQFLVVSFIILVVLAKMVWHHSLMHPVSNNIPESCMLIVVGAHIGGIIICSFYLIDCNRKNDVEPPFKFTPNLFFLYLLPPIVLEAGYFLNNRAFFENLPTILVYAVVGTLFNAFAVGLCLFGLFHAGLLLTGNDSVSGVNFTISSALLFGTICSAVDPVAVLAVFEDIHVNKMLHILVFGESLLNDAVTIVLFQVLGAFANRPLDQSIESNEVAITAADVFLGVAQFVVVVVASIIIGVVVGMVGAFFTRFTEHVHVLEPIVVFAMGYLSYILADMFAFSGIVSLIVTAIVMRHYVEANISRNSHTTIKYTMKVLSNIAEMIIFLFLGISLYEVSVHNWDTGLVLWTLVLVLLFRPIGVVVLTVCMNFFRVKKIDWKSVFIMSYSGLRGAVAFSLALIRISDEESLQHPTTDEHASERQLRRSMLTAVTVLVLFTVFVQGMTIKPIVRWLKVRTQAEHKLTMNEAIHATALDHITAGMEDILGHVGHNRMREKIRDIDSKYLRKIFERYPEARDEEILHTFKRLQYTESAKAAEKCVVFKWHENKTFGESHVSLYEPSGSPEPRETADEEECSNNDCEGQIPELQDILQASFASPHESHYSHMLSRHERDAVHDHRFEPVAAQRSKLKSKRDRRKTKKRVHARVSAHFRTSSVLAGLGGASPVQLRSFREGIDGGEGEAGQGDEEKIDGGEGEAGQGDKEKEEEAFLEDEPLQVEVELHDLSRHRDSEASTTKIIPGSRETDV